MADAHHDDHGNTPSAWFLTASWIVVWSIAGVAIILGKDLVTWTVVALAGSVVCAVIAGVMKKAGLGRKSPRVAPPSRAEWEAERAAAASAAPEKSAKKKGGDAKEPAAAAK
ncbi:HGxxPAAW family protein [Marinactinospora rubrisoli]|uniref:HGxxPAAW family protein n=1 Tax=Marinactinospora rubrisoli TaxID=2715399 RepID=A0ABW2KG66_9ACTN